MDKTVKINLAGQLFNIDEKAYFELRNYLKEIENNLKNIPGSNEILDDIEARIAEIFQSSKGVTDIITSEDVEAVKNIIGNPEEFLQDDATVKSSRAFYRRRVYRDKSNSILGGVCSGIGAYLNIDPVWIRVLFLIFAFTYAAGLIIYVILWIALPVAVTEIQKRELYGENYYSRLREGSKSHSGELTGALNSFFTVIGTILKICFRVIIAITGVALVVLGFIMLLSFVMIFYFKYPFSFLTGGSDPAIFSISEFLRLVTYPSLALWIMILLSLSVILPLAAVIFWGLKMIFRFSSNAKWISIISLVVWVLSFTALIMILFSQGINFAEKGRVTEKIIVDNDTDTLYIKIEKKLSQLDYIKELSVPGTNYSLFVADRGKRLYGKPEINILPLYDNNMSFSIEKIMFGNSLQDAVKKAESISFGYRYSSDTLYVDQYYEIPEKYKWSGSFLNAHLFLPDSIKVWIDDEAKILFNKCYSVAGKPKGNFFVWDGFKLKLPD